MLKEWVWWQIEASLEHLEDDSSIPLSDLTICLWMALAVKGCTGLLREEDHYSLHSVLIHGEAVDPVYLCCSDSLSF